MRKCENTSLSMMAAVRVALKQPHADAIFGLCEQLASPNYGGQF
jgi:hypothetical protein